MTDLQFAPSRRTHSRMARVRAYCCLLSACLVVHTHQIDAHTFLPSAVDRARRDVARGMFGKQIDEHGHALKRMESDHTHWSFCSTTSQLARRAAESGLRQEDWELVSITDCKQQPHMGLKYRFRVLVASRQETNVHREAELDVLWQSWHKPAYQRTRFELGAAAKFSGHTRFRAQAEPVHVTGNTAQRKVTRVVMSEARRIKQLQNVIQRYAKFKSVPKFKAKYHALEVQLEKLCHKDTLGTCFLLGCSSWRKAQCVHSRCQCPIGTCATMNKAKAGFVCESPKESESDAHAEAFRRQSKGRVERQVRCKYTTCKAVRVGSDVQRHVVITHSGQRHTTGQGAHHCAVDRKPPYQCTCLCDAD